MSLAEELLADFEDDEEESNLDSLPTASEGADRDVNESMDVDSEHSFDSHSTVRSVARLFSSEKLKKLIDAIDKRLSGEIKGATLTNKSQIDGPIESHPEYVLIVEANN